MYDGGRVVWYARAEGHKRSALAIAVACDTAAPTAGSVARDEDAPLIRECLVFPSRDCGNDVLGDHGWAEAMRLYDGNAFLGAGSGDNNKFDPLSRNPRFDAGDFPELVKHLVNSGPTTDQISHDYDCADGR